NSIADKPLVILLEQDPVQIESLAQAVESLNCLWAIARSQPELLEKVQQLRPQAVLLNLAVADSSDLLIKQLRAEAEPPMLIAIAAAETQAAKASQVDHVLPVPFDPAALQPLLARFRPVPPTLADVTVLLLKQAETLSHSTNPVDRLLQQYQCRVLEVDDVDQAKLLSQIWRPQVILLDPEIDNPETCLQRLSRQPALSSLPVVTLTNAATQFANQLATLRVFPCLASLESASANAASSPLLEVIQVAIQTCQSH
ncbi:MAG: hypothetical protein F6K04_20765, partial [Leptolyngbya sp. SIO4C5]|nr:hypothetical protein [Leptolyngbya sp. SIO4C5]